MTGERDMSDLKSLENFAEDFPDRLLSDFTVEEIKAWARPGAIRDEDEAWSALRPK